MKAITPIVVAVLLVLITVAITGITFIMVTRSVENSGSATQNATEQQLAQLSTNFRIDNTDNNKIYIRNTGTVSIPASNIAFYVNNQPVVATPVVNEIKPDEVAEFVLQISPGHYTLKVTAGAKSSVKPLSVVTVTETPSTTIATTTSSTTIFSTTTTIGGTTTTMANTTTTTLTTTTTVTTTSTTTSTTMSPVTVVLANEQVVLSFDFENNTTGWSTTAWQAGSQFTWENSTGHLSSRSLSINQSFANDARWVYSVNLNNQTLYRLTGWVKGANIVNTQGGSVGMNINVLTWDMTKGLLGTYDWTQDSFIFRGDTTEIRCRLGHFFNTVTGKGWCDDIVLTVNPLTKYEGTEVYFMLEPTDLSVISENKMKQWTSNMDLVYNSYKDLVGGVPFNGDKIEIRSVSQYPGGWAVAGNPIQWWQPVIKDELTAVANGDWSFGIMHEISHTFDLNNGIWNWEPEFWANTKMYYAVETLNAKVRGAYTGTQLKNYYQYDAGASWNNTLKNGVFSGDGLTYKFIQIREQIGWEPFKQTFRWFLANPNQVPSTNIGKFNLFLDKLTEYSSFDVRSLFTQTEMNAITAHYS